MDARAKAYESVGGVEQARFLYESAAEMLNMVYTNDADRLFDASLELARFYLRHAKFADADALLRRVTGLFDGCAGRDRIGVIAFLRERARLDSALADFPAAERALLEARQIACDVFGEEDSGLNPLDDDLVVVRMKMGKRDDALASMRALVARFDERSLAEDGDCEEAERMATFISELGDVGRAERLYRRVLSCQERKLGEWDPRYAQTLVNFGSLCRTTGRVDEAATHLRRAVKIRRAEFGVDHVSIARAQVRLALALAASRAADAPVEALAAVEDAFRIGSAMIGDVSATRGDRQLFILLREQRNYLDVALSVIMRWFVDQPDVIRRAFAMVLQWKAVGAETLAARRFAVLGGRHPHLRDRLEELDRLTSLMLHARLGGGAAAPAVESARKRREQLEAELFAQIPEAQMGRLTEGATAEAVAEALPVDAALIEYVRFTPFVVGSDGGPRESEQLPPRYLAFVLPAGLAEQIQLRDLGVAEPLERQLHLMGEEMVGRAADFRSALVPRDGMRHLSAEPDLNPAALGGSWTTQLTHLREAVFDPLVPFLRGRTRLYMAPDGAVSALPFDVLPLADGQCVIDVYRLSYLGTGREILRPTSMPDVTPSSPVIIAAPDFDPHPPIQSEPAGAPAGDDALPTVGEAAHPLQMPGSVFVPLPGAEEEGRLVAELLEHPKLLSGAAATKSAVRSLKSPVILHLATHGFYVPSDALAPAADDRAWEDAAASMLTSGLALAGANTWLRGADGSDGAIDAMDGVLTAEDVATLDLVATDMVVLSACRSGLGAAVAGQGVFGLRRAFLSAGARTIVMSLWKVPDVATKDLFTQFYRLLKNGTPKGEALRQARLDIRRKHPHPFYWGGFICQGDVGVASPSTFSNRE